MLCIHCTQQSMLHYYVTYHKAMYIPHHLLCFMYSLWKRSGRKKKIYWDRIHKTCCFSFQFGHVSMIGGVSLSMNAKCRKANVGHNGQVPLNFCLIIAVQASLVNSR